MDSMVFAGAGVSVYTGAWFRLTRDRAHSAGPAVVDRAAPGV